jgi:hypothetical protein
MAEVNMGLTTAMELFKFSESKPFEFRQTVAGPSGTLPYMNPQQLAAFQSPLLSSLKDTGSKYSWHARLRRGAGSRAAGGADSRPAGGADGGAAGGADGGAAGGADGRAPGGGPSAPPDPQPSDHGGAEGRRAS